MPVPILIAVLSTLSIGTGEFLAEGVTKRARSNEVTSTMFVGGVVLTAVLAVLWPGDPTARDLGFGALAGVANGAAVLLLYVAYSRGSLRSAAPAAAVVMSAVPVGWDLAGGGAMPSPVVSIGIGLGVLAIGLSSLQPRADKAHEAVRGEGLGLPVAILAGVVFGVLFILLGEVGEDAGGSPLLLQRSVGLIVALAVTRATGPRFFPAAARDRKAAFVVGLFATTAIILVVVALQAGGSLSMVSVISSQYAAVAVLLGVAVRGHRMRWWQAVGLGAASLAVALISIG